MTTLNIEKIGLVAHFSEQGDWAFNLAYQLARQTGLQLNIFCFAESPYDVPLDVCPADIEVGQLAEKEWVRLDRQLREYYDWRLDDYEDVGFRICEGGRHNLELRRCLKRKEYQVLVMPYLQFGMTFGNLRIEEFAYRFPSPVVLVGPKRAQELHLNPPAEVVGYKLGLPAASWKRIKEPRRLQAQAVI